MPCDAQPLQHVKSAPKSDHTYTECILSRVHIEKGTANFAAMAALCNGKHALSNYVCMFCRYASVGSDLAEQADANAQHNHR